MGHAKLCKEYTIINLVLTTCCAAVFTALGNLLVQ